MSKVINQTRINEFGEIDGDGRIFVNPRTATITDLSDIKILHCGVDTVRQMYKGRVNPEVLTLFQEPNILEFAGYTWHACRVGRDSGYQYKLQNSDLGLILLIKNFNQHQADIGSHLKIEVSPHFLLANDAEKVQHTLDSLADKVLDDWSHNYCAVHVALDVQGWEPSADIVQRMNCRSQKIVDMSGISSFEFNATASVYGRGESYLFGSPTACQLSIYNKTIQAKATDKLDYWESVWGLQTTDLLVKVYDDSASVWRIELRYHHNVIKQFAQGSIDVSTGEVINPMSYLSLAPHLDGILKYGFEQFKLLSKEHKNVLSADWCLFSSDPKVNTGLFSLIDETEYKRYYKSASGFSGKNIELFLGNFVSIIAREKVGATKAFEALKQWDCWAVIVEFFEEKGKTERDIYRWIRDKLTERVVRWGVAV